MRVVVLFFGAARELAAIREVPIELPMHSDVTALRALIAERYSGIDASLNYAVAINEVHAANSEVLKDGDVVAILPPVSGG